MRQRQGGSRTRLRASVVCAAAAAGLVGCGSVHAVPPTTSATPVVPTPPSAAAPQREPSADLARFSAVVVDVWDRRQSVAGRDYVDALAAADFDPSAMEVTFDRTSVGNPADSIQFSVRVEDGCLVGQVGPSVDEPVARLLPVTPGDTCLLGRTRPIDW